MASDGGDGPNPEPFDFDKGGELEGSGNLESFIAESDGLGFAYSAWAMSTAAFFLSLIYCCCCCVFRTRVGVDRGRSKASTRPEILAVRGVVVFSLIAIVPIVALGLTANGRVTRGANDASKDLAEATAFLDFLLQDLVALSHQILIYREERFPWTLYSSVTALALQEQELLSITQDFSWVLLFTALPPVLFIIVGAIALFGRYRHLGACSLFVMMMGASSIWAQIGLHEALTEYVKATCSEVSFLLTDGTVEDRRNSPLNSDALCPDPYDPVLRDYTALSVAQFDYLLLELGNDTLLLSPVLGSDDEPIEFEQIMSDLDAVKEVVPLEDLPEPALQHLELLLGFGLCSLPVQSLSLVRDSVCSDLRSGYAMIVDSYLPLGIILFALPIIMLAHFSVFSSSMPESEPLPPDKGKELQYGWARGADGDPDDDHDNDDARSSATSASYVSALSGGATSDVGDYQRRAHGPKLYPPV